ncbi:hypothetical protein L873DRAFT_1675556 [Choiromyces venosus 120613-1]|uniref:Uncharacterized protein n=1 Tax=Choiromyces venosus 120613-1 TaxID=1336337 RepID=A0A3N4JTD7_9PEZI|nr:hypothetical protein L873DRAFT_1675556 [Choiromyces venosus 120613-1]
MAEVVALVASVITLLDLTGKLALFGNGFISGAKRAPEEVRDLVDELNTLQKIIIRLKDFLGNEQQSLTLAKLEAIDGPLNFCLRDLQQLDIDLNSQSSGFFKAFYKRLGWPLREQETRKYIQRIMRHKSSLAIELGTYQLKISEQLKIQANKQDSWRAGEDSLKILGWLYKGKFDTRHIDIQARRKEGIGDWLLETPEFRGWRNGDTLPAFFGRGIPGAGKTFISSLVIDHLQSSIRKTGEAIAYIYFEYQNQTQQRPIDVVASLVQQLVSQLPRIPQEVEARYKEMRPKSPASEDLTRILFSMPKHFPQVFIVCDALDECDEKTQREDLLPLFRLMNDKGFRLFLTSRPHPEDIQQSLCYATKLNLSAPETDMRCYIQQRIERNPQAKHLVEKAGCLEEIISVLVENAKGVFLLVRFDIEHICQQPSVWDLKQELHKLKGLSHSSEEWPLDPTYDRIMETLRSRPKGSVDRAIKILSWLSMAQRTLTVEELRVAISVEADQYNLDDIYMPEPTTLTDLCAGLVVVDEQSDTIRLVHHAAQDYLKRKAVIESEHEVHLDLAITCIRYLSFDAFRISPEEPLKPLLRRYPFLDYAAKNLSFHLRHCGGDVMHGVLVRFLESSNNIYAFLRARDESSDRDLKLGSVLGRVYYHCDIENCPDKGEPMERSRFL